MTPLASALARSPRAATGTPEGRAGRLTDAGPATGGERLPDRPSVEPEQVASDAPALIRQEMIDDELADLLARLLATGERLAVAIEASGIAPEVAARLLRRSDFRSKVMSYLPTVEDVRARLIANASKAANVAADLLDCPDANERGKAARDLLDRVGVSAVRKVASVTLVIEERKARLLAAALDEAGLSLAPARVVNAAEDKEEH